MADITTFPSLTNPAGDDVLYVVDSSASTDNKITLSNLGLAGKSVAYLIGAAGSFPITTTPQVVPFAQGSELNFGGIDPLSGTITTPVTSIVGGGIYTLTASVITDYSVNDSNLLLYFRIDGTDYVAAIALSTSKADGVSAGASVTVQIPDATIVSLALSANTADAGMNIISGSFSLNRLV